MMDFTDKTLARTMARKVCSFIANHSKRMLCMDMLIKMFLYGNSFLEEFKRIMEREFTEEERRRIRERLAELMS
jgi:hypothetical protein